MVALLEKQINKRWTHVRDVLTKFAGRDVRVFTRPRNLEWIIGAGATPDLADLRHNRARTDLDGIWLNYYEIWKSTTRDKYTLQKAYFHVDRIDQLTASEEEIIALHCDLDLPSNATNFYRRGPHIHLAQANTLAHSHIALALQRLEDTCSKSIVFSEAMALFLTMIRQEVLERMR